MVLAAVKGQQPFKQLSGKNVEPIAFCQGRVESGSSAFPALTESREGWMGTCDQGETVVRTDEQMLDDVVERLRKQKEEADFEDQHDGLWAGEEWVYDGKADYVELIRLGHYFDDLI